MRRLQHPSPAKGSSLSVKKYQDLFKDDYAAASPSSPTVVGGRSDSMILMQPRRRNGGREMVVLRRQRASKVMVKRALTPPARKLTWRWFDFRPTPSRLAV
ncbi:hypothetical protein L6452_39842 [Arctium lappa]|uniref:Uncharacterized protein n=1 Tax=Arctium lappa TaxID=4217 RepID=A0ACB8XUJ7_ARCLA|nr:hypothetical protein L6452_39842 [Arctium lappa]